MAGTVTWTESEGALGIETEDIAATMKNGIILVS